MAAELPPAPFFAGHRLSKITLEQVDRYRREKVREGGLSPISINKTITRLGQILEVAVERELIPRNPAKVGGKRRSLPNLHQSAGERVAGPRVE